MSEVPRPPLDEKRLGRRKKRREVVEMANASTIGTVFPMAILIGVFAGQAIGGWLGNRRLGALVGLAVGVVSGFYNVYKVVKAAERRELEAERATAGDDSDEAKE